MSTCDVEQIVHWFLKKVVQPSLIDWASLSSPQTTVRLSPSVPKVAKAQTRGTEARKQVRGRWNDERPLTYRDLSRDPISLIVPWHWKEEAVSLSQLRSKTSEKWLDWNRMMVLTTIFWPVDLGLQDLFVRWSPLDTLQKSKRTVCWHFGQCWLL